MKQLIVFLFSLFIFQSAVAQSWQRIEGAYSSVEYQEPNKIIADSLLEIAELSIPRLAKIFEIPAGQLQKSKVRIILTDAPDLTNGYALADAVVIYALSSMYMDMVTGTQTWYSQVLKHELAHYLTFVKIKRKLSFIGELANLSVPRWFYEGIAQYFTENWNMFRGDIYLRNAVLSGKLTYSSLNNLEDGKLLYASAHAFTRYLADQYGDSCLVNLMANNAKGWLFDFDSAFRGAFGKNPEDIFTDFIRHLVIYYGDLLAEYPATKLPEALGTYGYRTFQVVPLSMMDSTYLVVSQVNKIHSFKTASIFKIRQGQCTQVRTISNHVNTDVFLNNDRSLAAYGRYYYGEKSNQINLKYRWEVCNLKSGQTEVAVDAIRARQAAFNQNNNLILCEIESDKSTLHQIDLKEKTDKIIFETAMPVGGLDCLPDNRLVIAAQRNNGFRDLFVYSDSGLLALTDDAEDDRNPIVVNDSLIIFNRIIDDNPALAVYNFKTKSAQTILNDQYAYWLRTYDPATGKIVLSTWDADGRDKFSLISIDKVYRHPVKPVNISKKEKYASWTDKHPTSADMIHLPDTSIQNVKAYSIRFPQADLIHLFSAAIPLYDSEAGFGLFGITSWLEPLQRQALAAMFAVYENNFDQSLIIATHNLIAFNSFFLTSYYHGPVIFSYQDGSYIEMTQDIGELMWSKRYFIRGNNRFTFSTSLAYSGHYYKLHEYIPDAPNKFGYNGPSIRLGLGYLLPTKLYPFLPKRAFEFSVKYFRSMNRQYDFGISETNALIASNLIIESIGFKTRFTAINKHGNLPSLKTIGIDRFYEFDFPRDFKYTRPVRGIRRDLSSDRLYWSSTELTYLLSEHTGMTLLVLPIDNLAVKGFFDFASLGKGEKNQVYGYGGEISFGQSIYNAAFGVAKGNLGGEKTNREYYIRLSLYFPEI